MKIARKKTKNSGFTFVELMVANVVAILAIGMLFYISLSIQKNIGLITEVLGISEKGRFAINRMTKDIREATFVVPSHGTYATGDETVVLQLPAIKDGNVKLPISYFDYVIYKLDSSDPEILLRIVDGSIMSERGDTSEPVTEDIDSLTFYYQGTALSSIPDKGVIKTLTVELTTKGMSGGVERKNTITTSTSLRNKEQEY